MQSDVATNVGTERKPALESLVENLAKAERDLADSLKRWEGLASRLPLGVFRVEASEDDSLAVEYVNERLLSLLGDEDEGDEDTASRVGRLPEVFVAGIDEPLRARFQAAIAASVSSREEFSWRGEVTVKGESRLLRVSAWPESCAEEASGRRCLFTGIVEDLSSERRSAELRRLALFKLGELSGILTGAEEGTPEVALKGQAVWTSLSSREREVAVCVLEGMSNGDIAARLGISLSTSKKHVNALFRKLGVKTRAELFALERGTK